MYHTSDPVPVRRPALLDWTSSRPHLTMTPLPFLLASGELLTFGSVNTWYEDFHLASPVPCPAHTNLAEWCANNLAASAPPKFSASTQALGSAILPIDSNIAYFDPKIDYAA